jgi:hypothetical protein
MREAIPVMRTFRLTSILCLVFVVGCSSSRTSAAQSAETTKLLARDWQAFTLTEALAVAAARETSELYAPVTSELGCTSTRVLSTFHTVEQGHCLRCERLEFALDQSARYVLRSALIDEPFDTERLADSRARAVLLESGISREFIQNLSFGSTSPVFSVFWVRKQEYRAIDLRIDRVGSTWRLHLILTRERAPGEADSGPR